METRSAPSGSALRQWVPVYLAAVGTGGLATLVWWLPSIPTGQWPHLLALSLLYAYFIQVMVPLPSGAIFSPAGPLHIAAAAAFGCGAVCITVPGLLLHRLTMRMPPLRVYFNLGQFSLSLGAAAAAFRAAGGEFGRLVLPADLPALLVLTVVYDAVNAAWVALRVALERGASPWGVYLAVQRDRRMAQFLYYVLAMVAALLYQDRGLWGLVLVSLALVALHHFLRTLSAVRETRRLVFTDRLTGTYNYQYFLEWSEDGFPALLAAGRPFCLLFIDLDNLRDINNRFGHPAGNQALQAVAQTLRDITRTGDVVVRYGGDEFVVVLRDAAKDTGLRAAQRIVAALRRCSLEIDGRVVRPSASVGVASYPDDATTPQDLVRAADHAMYLAKERGPNQVSAAGSPASESL